MIGKGFQSHAGIFPILAVQFITICNETNEELGLAMNISLFEEMIFYTVQRRSSEVTPEG